MFDKALLTLINFLSRRVKILVYIGFRSNSYFNVKMLLNLSVRWLNKNVKAIDVVVSNCTCITTNILLGISSNSTSSAMNACLASKELRGDEVHLLVSLGTGVEIETPTWLLHD